MNKKPLVSILIPHYKTLKLTKLCLRLIRKYTDFDKARVIVIDNNSQDASTEYLRSLKWITLIERDTSNDKTPPLSHANALDDALAIVDTPYVLSIHTDTLVKHPNWLDYLIKEIEKDETIAGAGSWKLEQKPLYRRVAKKIEAFYEHILYDILGKKRKRPIRTGGNILYLRSHCAIYRTAILKKHHLSFSDGEASAGKVMHTKILKLGYQMKFIDSAHLIRHIEHVNHATMILNPNLGARKRTVNTGLKRMKKILNNLRAEQILQNEALDQ